MLSSLVASYEKENHPITDASEADVLRLLMTSNGLTQASLAAAVGIAASTVSSVLKGDRSLTKQQVVKLANYFHVNPGVFLPAVADKREGK